MSAIRLFELQQQLARRDARMLELERQLVAEREGRVKAQQELQDYQQLAQKRGADEARAAYRRGMRDEREWCARVCDEAMGRIFPFSDEVVQETGRNVCTNLAKAIRARSGAAS